MNTECSSFITYKINKYVHKPTHMKIISKTI